MKKVIALAGNPNVGKSTVFNHLTGLRQHTGNWAGKTVECAAGTCKRDGSVYEFVDLPGCYSLVAHSKEEEIARNYLCKETPDAVVVVCDATCLERNLNLLLQVMALVKNVVLCVNLLDEAKKKKIRVDLAVLEKELGIPVIGCSARNGEGVEQIFTALERVGEEKITCQEILTGQKQEESFGSETFIKRAQQLCERAVVFENPGYDKKDRMLDRIFTGRKSGFLIMFLGLSVLFWITGVGANIPSAYLQEGAFWLEEKLILAAEIFGVPAAFYEPVICGAYRVMAWVVSVMLPPMAIFFPLFTLLEDFGYLPRVAFNLDKCFQKCHACGKQALTMCMGFGCNAVGVTGCRIIDSKRERMLAILTNVFVPCNGRFPTMIALLSMFFVGSANAWVASMEAAFGLAMVILLGVVMTLTVSGILSRTILKGLPSAFTLELPPYRHPQIGRVLATSIFNRTVYVLGRAVVVAAPAGLFIWILANVKMGNESILGQCVEFLEPFGQAIGLDGVILMAFILGMPANEIVLPIMLMTYLSQGNLGEVPNIHIMKEILVSQGWTWLTALNVILFSLLHWPCATTCLTIRKETGSVKWMFLAILIPTATGVVVCFLVTSAVHLLNGIL